MDWGSSALACPGRGAAFFMPLRRAGTVQNTGVRYGPGSAAHHAVKDGVLRCVRDTRCYPALDSCDGAGICTIGGLALSAST